MSGNPCGGYVLVLNDSESKGKMLMAIPADSAMSCGGEERDHSWKLSHDTGKIRYSYCLACDSRKAYQPPSVLYDTMDTKWVCGKR